MNAWKGTRGRVVICLLATAVLLWTVFIFAQSAKSGEESSSDSESVVEIIEDIVQSVVPDAEVSSHFVRKLAHFTEYLILGLMAAALVGYLRGRWLFAAAWGYAFVVANCDEFIVQRMSEGRGPQFTDVLIDSAGALVGVIGVMVLLWLMMRRRRRLKLGDSAAEDREILG